MLTRRIGEEIVIADSIRLTIVALRKGRVRLGITAPESVPIARGELVARHTKEHILTRRKAAKPPDVPSGLDGGSGDLAEH